MNSTFKSRKNLMALIQDKTESSSVRNLKITANILVILLYLLAGLDYFFAIY